MNKNEITIFSYLSGLAANNNREWYHAHKVEYQEANRQFEELIQDLIFKIGQTDGSILHNVPKDLTFKLVRAPAFFKWPEPWPPLTDKVSEFEWEVQINGFT